METITIGIIGIIALIILLFSGIPVGFSMAIIGITGFSYLTSIESGFNLLAKDIFSTFSSYSLTVIPMFIFMGQIAFSSGIASKLYLAAYGCLGRTRGGMAMATMLASAAFSAICGSTNATAASMGIISIPEMRRYKYDMALATGSVAAGGSLGILIPPSVVFIVYGTITSVSIGKLFMAGVFPGLLLTLLFIISIYIFCKINPDYGPSGPSLPIKDRLVSLLGVAEVLLLFTLVIGGLFKGFFTPTEAGAVGASSALLISFLRGGLTWRKFWDAVWDSLRISCMVMVILAGAVIFGHFLAVSKIPLELAAWVKNLPLPPAAIIGIIALIYLIGGCFVDMLAAILLTVPIYFPVITELGYNPIVFGVIIVLMGEAGTITPPVGINVYIVKGVTANVPIETIFRGAFPFLIAILITVIMVMVFPNLALFLPHLMR
jgi:C4-dicarboxylate transporter DctM subunit